MSSNAPPFDPAAPAAAGVVRLSTEPPPYGAANSVPIFEDASGNSTFVSIQGGHETTHNSVSTRMYVAADGGKLFLLWLLIDNNLVHSIHRSPHCCM